MSSSSEQTKAPVVPPPPQTSDRSVVSRLPRPGNKEDAEGEKTAAPEPKAPPFHPYGDVESGLESIVLRLLPGVAADADAVERCKSQNKLAGSVGSATVCAATSIADGSDDRLCITRPPATGELLSALVAAGPVPPDRVVVILRRVADALVAVHDVGVAHGALGPWCIVLPTDPKAPAVIFDWGLGELIGAKTPHRGPAAELPFSPASILGFALEPSQDIYVLGALGFRMLAGAPLFSGVDAEHVARRHAIEDPPGFHGINAELSAIIGRCVAKDPEDRYADAGELREALASIELAESSKATVAPAAKGTTADGPRAGPLPKPEPKPVQATEESGSEAKPTALAPQPEEIEEIEEIEERSSSSKPPPIRAPKDSKDLAESKPPLPPLPVAVQVVDAQELEELEEEPEALERAVEEKPEPQLDSAEVAAVLPPPAAEEPAPHDFPWGVAAAVVLAVGVLGAWVLVGTGEESPAPTTSANEQRTIAREVPGASSPEAALPTAEVSAEQGDLASDRPPETAGEESAEAPVEADGGRQPEQRPLEAAAAVAEGPPPENGSAPAEDTAPQEPLPSDAVESEVPSSPPDDPAKTAKQRANDLARAGQRAWSSGDAARAKSLFNQALANQASNRSALEGLGGIAFDSGSDASAIRYFRRALKSAPGRKSLRIRLGDAYYRMAKYSDAAAQYRKAKGHPKAASRLSKAEKAGG